MALSTAHATDFCHLKDKGTKSKDSKKAPSSFDFFACSVEPCCQSARICHRGTAVALQVQEARKKLTEVSHVVSTTALIIPASYRPGWCRFHQFSDLFAVATGTHQAKDEGSNEAMAFLLGRDLIAMERAKSKAAVI